jgi:hypothetical protein
LHVFFCHTYRGIRTIQDQTTGPRRGKNKTFTIDPEALELLEELSLGKHCQGRLMSALIRQEALRRAERARLRQQVLALFDDDEEGAAAECPPGR